MINKGKNQQIEINEKTFNSRGTKEENRSAELEQVYKVFAFLFQVLVAGQPYFCLIALVVRSQTIVVQAIKSVILIRGEFAIGLSGLFLWKVLSSFCWYCTTNEGF